MDFEIPLIGTVSTGEMLFLAAWLIVLYTYLKYVRNVFGKKKKRLVKGSFHYNCNVCDWKGDLTKYAGKCPKCGAPLDL